MRVAVSSKNSFVGIMTSHVRVGVLKLRFIIPRMHAIIHRLTFKNTFSKRPDFWSLLPCVGPILGQPDVVAAYSTIDRRIHGFETRARDPLNCQL